MTAATPLMMAVNVKTKTCADIEMVRSACACAFLPGVVDAAHNSGLVGEVGKKEEEREEEEEEEDGSPASDCDEEEEEGVEQQAKEEEKEEEEESAEDTGRI